MKSRSTIWFVLFGSLIALSVWLWFGREMGQVTHLRCARVEPTQVDCSIRQTWLQIFDTNLHVNTLTNLKHVEFKEECADDCYYYVALHTRNDTLTVRATWEDQSTVMQINSFLDGTLDVGVLEISVGGSGWEFVMYALFGVALILAALSPWWFEKLV